MTREEVLVFLAFLLIFEGYLTENITPAILSLGIGLYLALNSSSVKLSVNGNFILESDEVTEGEKVGIEINLQNHGSDTVISMDIMGEYITTRCKGIYLPQGSKKKIQCELFPDTMGILKVGPIKVTATDPRGLYKEEFILGKPKFLRVYPSLNSIRNATKVDHNLRLATLYKKSAPLGGSEIEIRELRKYQYGDDFKKIDWKASARIGELIVKEFIKESDSDVYIFLDATREMRKGAAKAKIDYGVELALQLAVVLCEKYNVGLVIYDEKDVELIKPAKGWRQVEIFRQKLILGKKNGMMSLTFELENLGKAGRKFLTKVLPFKKGRKERTSGILKGLAHIEHSSYLIFITDLNSPRELYQAITKAKKYHKVLILSPNPILFYSDRLDEKTLERLYKAYEDRMKLIKRFNVIAPTIDLGPSDYIKELSKVLRATGGTKK